MAAPRGSSVDEGGRQADDRFVPGESAVRPNGNATPQERKSPPLADFIESLDDYLRVAPERYFSRERMELEWERLWTRTWLCAGRVSDLPAKGSWFRYDIGRESFVIVREDEHRIAAFYNVCQHRGNRLVDADFGRNTTFVCPYHSWSYDRGGRCIHVTDRGMFRPAALAGSLDIPTVRCEQFGGFVFICINGNTQPLSAHLGEMADIVQGYRMERMEVRSDASLDLACNWKLMLDAFSEVYHAHITHPGAAAIIEDRRIQTDFYANGHTRRIVPVGEPSGRLGRQAVLNASQRFLLAEAGLDPEVHTGNVRLAVQQAKRAMTGPRAQVYSTLSDNQLTDDWAINIFANIHWSLHAEGMLLLTYNPHPSDPNQCRLGISVLAHPGIPFDLYYMPDAKEHEPSGRPRRVRLRHDDPDLAAVIGHLLFEDIRNTRETQQGIQSRGFGGVRLSEQEQALMHQNAEMDRLLFQL